MKKQIKILSFSFLLVAAVALTASTQQGKSNKDHKEQQQHKGNGQDKKGNADKANKGNSGNDNNEGAQGKMNKSNNNGHKDNKGKNEMHTNGNNNMHENKGKDNNMNHGNMGNGNDEYGYNWNRENFKDRKKFKNQDKVTICHKFNRVGEDAVTINVSANAAKAHMNHGDVMGTCPAITGNRRFSDIFMRNRTDYYNNLQNGQEQVYYSRSILDYALLRLASSRLQLNNMQNNNMPVADIQRKQGTVVELEQNVSLLQTVLGVAANLVASKFQ